MARYGLDVLSTVFDIARLKNRLRHGDSRLLHRQASSSRVQEQPTDEDVADSSDDFRLPRMRSLVTMLTASMLMQVRSELVYQFSPNTHQF